VINFKDTPKAHNVAVDKTFMDVNLTHGMPDIRLLFVFAPLLIQPMQLACHILVVHQVKSLLHPSPSQLSASGLELHIAHPVYHMLY
jgi:hypothetical protein